MQQAKNLIAAPLEEFSILAEGALLPVSDGVFKTEHMQFRLLG